MKKTYIALSLALAAVMLTGCNKQNEGEETSDEPAAKNSGELKIAYIEIDSLTANYQLCKDYTEIGNIEGQNIQNTLESKQRSLEQHYSSLQKKYESNGFSSQEEFQRAQASLQKEQQELEELNARLTTSFQEQQVKYNDEMRDSIQSFLKVYNKNKKYDFIMSKAGDNMLYANPKYDITEEVLKGLNKRYKPYKEVAEKLKNAPAKKEEKKK